MLIKNKSSIISEPLDLDFTNLETYYDRRQRQLARKKSQYQNKYSIAEISEVSKSNAAGLKDCTDGFHSIILSGRYIDCGNSTTNVRHKLRKTITGISGNEHARHRFMNQSITHENDSLLSEK